MLEPIRVNADTPAIEDERIPAFIITRGGEDITYTIPKQISGATALRALEVFVMRGEGGLVAWLANHALGEEGMQAVIECEQLDLDGARALLEAIGNQYVGQVKGLGKQ